MLFTIYLQIALTIFILLKLHYYNKPITGASLNGRVPKAFYAQRRRGGSPVLIGLIAFSALMMFVMCIVTVHNIKQDGAYAFYDKSVNLNEYTRRGNVPEDGTYVTLDFNMIGEEFYPIASNYHAVYFPVVLKESKGSSGHPHVVAVCIDEKDEEKFISFINDHKSKFNRSDSNGRAGLAYDGRIIEFTDEMKARYNNALQNSGITEDDYDIKPYVINTRIDKEDIRKSLIRDISLCHALFCFAFILFIDYLIDEGKLD